MVTSRYRDKRQQMKRRRRATKNEEGRGYMWSRKADTQTASDLDGDEPGQGLKKHEAKTWRANTMGIGRDGEQIGTSAVLG